MECRCCFLGFLLLAAGLPLDAAMRFHDVLSNERPSAYTREHNQLNGWSSDENDWNEKLYPVWKKGDLRWRNCWKGGHVQAVLTSDSPALVGSNITFAVNLVCQKEDANGNIVYEKNCRNDTGLSPDPYVYNWTAWIEDGDGGNNTDQSHYNVFPDGKPFPHHPGWKKWKFVYIFHTLGQYFQRLGRCSVTVAINTANVTLGPQLMEVTVYRRHGRAFVPIAKVKDIYMVTDQIPLFVTMAQKNDRNSSDETFLKDLPITFDVLIHDPSHFLNQSAIYYKWNFGDNTGLFVSNNHISNHTYVLNGTFSLNLTVQVAVPGPCPLPSPTPPKPTPSSVLATTLKSYHSNSPVPVGVKAQEPSDESCQIYRYGHFNATITIVEGLLEVNIIQMTDVPMPVTQPGSSLMDFVVTCQGTVPTEVCTIISDPTCQLAQDTVCDPVDVDSSCLLTVRRAFKGPGTFCVNLTLHDEASLALASTLVSVPGRDPASPLRMANGVVVSIGCLMVLVTVIALLLYKKYKEYKPIESAETQVRGKSLDVFLNRAKATFFPGNQEKDPLLKNQPGII